MDSFLFYALAAGIGVALISGPLGSFIVWRKMAYFGDTLAHAALLGIALGLFFDINIYLSIGLAGVVLSLLLCSLQNKVTIATDSLLGILSHASLAVGLVSISFFSDRQIDIFSYLFGDILTVTLTEIAIIYIIAFVSLGLLAYFWRPLLMMSIDEDLAKVEGHSVERLRIILMLLIASLVAIAIKIVGALLITALLIIPAASSSRLASSPEAMAIIASVLGALSVVTGLLSSYFFDTPAGPSIVLTASGLFLLSFSRKARA